MKKGKVFFHPIEGSGSLTISWSSLPKGDAIEAQSGAGVGFFSEKGDLLCVIFDDVLADNDCQSLDFKNYKVEVVVKDSQVSHVVTVANERVLPLRKRRKVKKTV